MGRRAGLVEVEKIQRFLFLPRIDPRSSSPYPVNLPTQLSWIKQNSIISLGL
jgi:hypothetical protein